MNRFFKSHTWAITLALAAVGAAYLYFGFLPAKARIDALRRELAQQKVELAGQQSLAATLVTIRERLDETGGYVGKWREHAPSPTDLTDMFGQITLAVRASGASLDKFDPLAPTEFEYVQKVPLRLAVRGSFVQMQSLLRNIERLPYGVWIEGLKIEGSADKSTPLVSEINLAVFAANPESSD